MASPKDPTPPPAESTVGSGGFAASASAADLRAQADALDAAALGTYSLEDAKRFAGDLKPGEIGWIALNEHGEPTGTATREMPQGKPAARVVGFSPLKYEEITTSTGAPITKHMNPIPELWDEGMKQRNPVPGNPQPPTTPDVHPKANPPPSAPANKK